MAMTFRYRAVRRPDGTEVKAPLIPVTFSGSERFRTVALLDSGADVSAMPRAVAEILGIDLSVGVTTAYGIGGRVESIETKVFTTISKGHERYRFKTPMKVILGEYDFPILLGRLGFFDKFVIRFDQDQEKVTLKRIVRR